jgi:hypothetical protein
MDCRERMIRALERKELPDRVPIFVEGMMTEFKRKSWATWKRSDLWNVIRTTLTIKQNWLWAKYYRFDAIWLHSSPIRMKSLTGIYPDKIDLGNPNRRVGRYGGISQKTIRNGEVVWPYQTGYLNTKELWQQWINAGYFDYEVNSDWIRRWEKDYPRFLQKDIVLVPVDVIFEKIREAFDFGRFSYFYRKELSFLKMLSDRIFKIALDHVKGCCDAGFDILTLADDCAYKNRVMFSPTIFDELVKPGYKMLNDYLHKRGKLSFFHSDGYTEPFFPGLISAGFDGIQSLEPAAGMDLKLLKNKYGKQVTLIGNLDCSRLLPFGSVGDVVDTTRQCLNDAMQEGGYICGPTTDIIDSCKPENIKAMVDTVHKYGYYRLN